MKKYIILIILLLIANTAFCDKFIIPFSCYPEELQKEFAEYDRKLDLDGKDRTEDSWGFIFNEGSQYIIYTYKSATMEDLDIMKEIIFNQ